MIEQSHMAVIDTCARACRAGCLHPITDILETHFPQSSVQVRKTAPSDRDAIQRKPRIAILRALSVDAMASHLQAVRQQWEGTPVVGLFCGAHPTLGELSGLYRKGLLHDYVVCPVRELDFIPRVAEAMKLECIVMPASSQEPPKQSFSVEKLVGHSHIFMDKVRRVSLIAGCEATVLITGETGTGKELFARAIHYHSSRRGGPFIPLNCAALPDQLLENELFGHTKGAYTHADSKQQGLIAEAELGTLFLDEVDSLSLVAQTKLLRFLQDRCYRQLGSPKSIAANVRIIAATNANLLERVQAKCFREDLYYRLNVLTLAIPALRQRPEDIPLLAEHLLKQFKSERIDQPISLSPSALNQLSEYAWPGNVRELESVLQHAVVLASSSVLEPVDLGLPTVTQTGKAHEASLQAIKSSTISEVERAYLIRFLKAAKGNVSQAAKAGGTERRTFQRLLLKHKLKREAFQGG
jgi:DNA-binding NtrC family response regulator